MARNLEKKLTPGRPRRGSPQETQERLLDAASTLFNREGYHGTDSNQIAHKAGYATGTFYKHFRDKKQIFLAVYARWISAEWKSVEAALASGETPERTARALVDLTVGFHTKWRGLRSSLLLLVSSDTDVRRFYYAQRRNQLDLMARLRARFGTAKRTREQDALHLYLTERVFDAVGQGEIKALGLDQDAVLEVMVERTRTLLK
jgi:AcrR family transcriptional regulator